MFDRNNLPRIEEVVAASIELKQEGGELVGHHSVHESSSKTSLHISPRTQTWYCFHCGQGGDVVDWFGFAMFGQAYDRRKDFPAIAEAIEAKRYPLAQGPLFSVAPEPSLPEWNPEVYLEYHRQVRPEYWHKELGPGSEVDDAIEHFKLGYCESHPSLHYPSHTIPIFLGGKVVNIRHRLIAGEQKYAPHVRGLGAHLFNLDEALTFASQSGRMLVLAGEKKVIAAWSRGIHEVISPTIGCSFKDEWIPLLAGLDRIYILFDPGEEVQAQKVSAKLGAKVLSLPAKLDDFLRDGGTMREVFSQVIEPDCSYWSRKLGVPLPPIRKGGCRFVGAR